MSNIAYPTDSATHTGATADVKVTGRRVVANLIDGFLLVLVGGLFLMLFGVEADTAVETSGTASMWTMSPVGTLLYAIVAIGYYVGFEGALGRTPGKFVSGIRVVDEATGNKPNWGQAAVRTLLRIVDGLFSYVVAFVVVLTNDRRRRIGDMAAKTLVVRA